MLERDACTSGNCPERVFSHVELYVNLVGEALCKSAEKCAASREVDSSLDDVGVKLRWSLFENMQNDSLDYCDGIVKAGRYFLVGHSRLNWVRCHQVRSVHLH